MKKLSISVMNLLIVLMAFAPGWGGTVGDIDGDGVIGLSEAIHALRVTAGMQAQAQVQTYDLSQCLFVPGHFLFRGSDGSYERDENFFQTVKGKNTFVRTIIGRGAVNLLYYYSIGDSRILGDGLRVESNPAYTVWYDPPIILGDMTMKIGDRFFAAGIRTMEYENPPAPMPQSSSGFLQEYRFVGVEDVSTPAGMFENCLALLSDNGASWTLRFYAPGIGLVKEIGTSGSIYYELVYGQVGERTYPEGLTLCGGSYVKSRDGNPLEGWSSDFLLEYNPLSHPVKGSIVFWGTQEYVGGVYFQSNGINVVSDDGLHFSPDPAVYGDSAPVLNLTIQDNVISGTYAFRNDYAQEILLTMTGHCD